MAQVMRAVVIPKTVPLLPVLDSTGPSLAELNRPEVQAREAERIERARRAEKAAAAAERARFAEAERRKVRKVALSERADEEIRAATPEKNCGKCKTVKPSTEFHLDRGKGDGLCSCCKGCSSRRVKSPERKRAAKARRRARKRNATVERFTHDQLMSFWRANGIDPGKCWYCDAPAEHHDHFQPLVLDGAHTMDNLVPACGFHNLSKGGRDPWTFVRPFVLDVRAVHEEDGGVRIEIYRKVDARSP